MMTVIKSKVLSDSAWKDVLSKNKGVKDNGLLKTLAEIKGLREDEHDDAQGLLEQLQKLVAQLKKSKEIAAVPAVGKFLAELSGAAETAVRDVAKAKAEADKKSKAEAEAARKRQHEEDKGDRDEAEEQEEDAAALLLGPKLVPLLRQVAKGETMHTLIAKSGKQVAVMLSRKPIPPARRKLLAEQLGGGSTKYYPGHCTLEAGATTFALKAEVAGMAKLIKAALLEQTGLRLNKVKCRGHDGDDDDEGEEEAPHAPGKGSREDGDEPPKFVPGVDIKPEDDRDSEEVPKFVPGVDIEPREQVLAKAPQVWKGTRALLQTNIDALKKAIQAQIADEAGDLIDETNDQLQKLDRILVRLDKRLTNSLTNAMETQDPTYRNAALKESRTILAEYIRYVSSEPLIDHLDSNPFGVKTELKATLAKSLTQLAKAIG